MALLWAIASCFSPELFSGLSAWQLVRLQKGSPGRACCVALRASGVCFVLQVGKPRGLSGWDRNRPPHAPLPHTLCPLSFLFSRTDSECGFGALKQGLTTPPTGGRQGTPWDTQTPHPLSLSWRQS